jgi:oligopeptidase A
MADFRASGAELPPDKKKRHEELEAELAQVTQKFSENVLDSTNAWELVIDDEAKLAGLRKAPARRPSRTRRPKASARLTNRLALHAQSAQPDTGTRAPDNEGVRRKVLGGKCRVGHTASGKIGPHPPHSCVAS